MSTRTNEQKRAYRQKLRAAGLCRDCHRPSDGKLRCAVCQRKKSLPELPKWLAVKRAMRDHLGSERGDRRMSRGGPFKEDQKSYYCGAKALDWALVLHLA